MRRGPALALPGVAGIALALVAVVVTTAVGPAPTVRGAGVGDASWTPSRSDTTAEPSSHLVPADSLTYVTRMAWSPEQRDGLAQYVRTGLRYTHEVNDRGGRLSATGYWATDLPDPAFDRDDDDGDGRWEEAEITAGTQLPDPGATYTALIQFSRWHPVQRRVRCDWAWDLRAGQTEVLSQLSRKILGEWQALRYTLAYEQLPYGRQAPRPGLPSNVQRPDCGPAGNAVSDTDGIVVTFARPIAWADLLAMTGDDAGGWVAFEATGRSQVSDRRWTCGGPVGESAGLERCGAMGVQAEGVVAAGAHVSGATADRIRRDPRVASVADWRDQVPTWMAELAGFTVEPPDLTLDDAWWKQVAGR